MKQLLFILMLVGSALAQMQPLVQAASQGTHTTGLDCIIPHVVTGQPIIAVLSSEAAITGITDSLSSTIGSPTETSTANSIFTDLWVFAAGGTGQDTINFSGTTHFNNVNCIALDPDIVTTTVDVHNNGSYAGTPSTITTTGLTPTVNGDLLYTYISGFSSSGLLRPVAPLQFAGASNGGDSAGAGYELLGVSGSSYSATFANVINSQGNYVQVALKPVAMKIYTSALPTGVINKTYSYQLQALNGSGAYTWSITSGSLQTGLSLNSSTGLISGTPTVTGINSITFQVTDGTTSVTKILSLEINSSANIPTLIQGVNCCATPSLTFVNVGDIIVLVSYIGQDGFDTIIAAPTDSLSPPTPFHFVGAQMMDDNQAPVEMTLYVGKALGSGVNTITPSTTGGSLAAQFSNAQGFTDTSVFMTGTSAATSILSSSPITTVSPNSMILATCQPYTSAAFGTTIAAVSPFTFSADFTTPPGAENVMLSEYKMEATVGSYTPQCSVVNNVNGGGAFNFSEIALRPATTGLSSTFVARHPGWIN